MIHKTYRSLDELVSVALNSPSTMTTNERHSRTVANNDRRNAWYSASWDEASQWAAAGDVAGARRLAPTMLQAVNSFVHGQKRLDPEYRLDEGQWIDVARYVKGEPECWGAMVEADPSPRQGVAVIVNVAAASRILASSIDRVGVNIGGAILGLQATGHSVTLYVAEKIRGHSGDELLTSAPVNPGAGPLDAAKLSIILRPWFLRRIIFSLQETYDANTRDKYGIGDSYGSPLSVRREDATKIMGVDDKAVIVDINTASQYPEGVKDLILRQINGGK